MAQNLVQKIIGSHLVSGEMHAGKEVAIRIDQTLTQDATGTMAYLQFEAMGIPNYRSIVDVPEPVDYVIVNTPRRVAVDVFAECVEAGVGAVSFFTSGFAETDDEGVRLQEELADMSRRSGVPLFGPNCTGAYNPVVGICSSADMPVGELGPVGVVSQSGTHAGYFVKALFAWPDRPPVGDIESREALIAEANTPEALAAEAAMSGLFDACDTEANSPLGTIPHTHPTS